jgi:hypothetical protein
MRRRWRCDTRGRDAAISRADRDRTRRSTPASLGRLRGAMPDAFHEGPLEGFAPEASPSPRLSCTWAGDVSTRRGERPGRPPNASERYEHPSASAVRFVTPGRAADGSSPSAQPGARVESCIADGELRAAALDRSIDLSSVCFRAVDALLTKFHLPGSTLWPSYCAFAGRTHPGGLSDGRGGRLSVYITATHAIL